MTGESRGGGLYAFLNITYEINFACLYGNLERLKWLLEKYFRNVNKDALYGEHMKDDMYGVALVHAVNGGNNQIVQYILDNYGHLDVNADYYRIDDVLSPLVACVASFPPKSLRKRSRQSDALKVFRTLIEYGADVRKHTLLLDVAIQNHRNTIIDFLIDNEFDLSTQSFPYMFKGSFVSCFSDLARLCGNMDAYSKLLDFEAKQE